MTETFARLLAKREQQGFDDEYLRLADAYEAEHPHSEVPAVFRGAYALAHDDAQQALAQAKQAFSLRPLNFEVWQLLVRCYEALGDVRHLAYFEALCKKFYEVPLHLDLQEGYLEESMGMLSLGLGIGNYAPFAKARVRLVDGKPKTGRGIYVPSAARRSRASSTAVAASSSLTR